ncbi:putative transmembrane protein [unidentified eubacterium SCB49]|nr:putative transmembrane protein [unidentified eubacterium SCB49]
MDNFQIETAQNVNIVQNVAGVGDRILAYIIDAAIMGVYYFIVFLLVVGTIDALGDSAIFLVFMVILLPVLVYHLLFEMFWDGKSPGKAVMKLKVVKLDGSKPAFSNFLLRWLLRVIDIGLVSGSVALVTILLNGKGQRLGDIAASTTVISEKTPVSFSQTILTDIPDDYIPKYPQVTVFSDAEIQKIKQIYRENKYKGNHHIILRLSERISKVMDVEIDGMPIEFVDKVIKDYNYYTQNM